MKISMTIKKELKFLEAFFELSQAKLGIHNYTPTAMLNLFKEECSKLVTIGQVTEEAVCMFLDGIGIDDKIKEAKIRRNEADKEIAKLVKEKAKIAKAKQETARVVDPCSRSAPIRSSC
jgi:hypothetical protein